MRSGAGYVQMTRNSAWRLLVTRALPLSCVLHVLLLASGVELPEMGAARILQVTMVRPGNAALHSPTDRSRQNPDVRVQGAAMRRTKKMGPSPTDAGKHQTQSASPAMLPAATTPQAPLLARAYGQLDSNGLAEFRLNLASLARGYDSVLKAQGVRARIAMRVTVNRRGVVLPPSIERSSGHAGFDAAALHMFRQIAPQLRVPVSLHGEEFSLLVPLEVTADSSASSNSARDL